MVPNVKNLIVKRLEDEIDDKKIDKMYSENGKICCKRECNKIIPQDVAVKYRYFQSNIKK